MVMDLGRGGGGRAPLLVFGLILICIFLIFNWWSLSSQNLELFRQLEERGEHLKLGSRKILECNRLREELEKEVSSAKQLTADKNSAYEEMKKSCNSVKLERDNTVESFNQCNVELESLKKVRSSQDVLIESRKVEKEQLESELKDKKTEITRLMTELKQAQEKLNQKVNQPKGDIAAVPAKEDTNPANHEGKNAVDAAAAAINTLDQNDDAENKEGDNAIEDDREKEQERENARNTADAPRSS